MSQWIPVAVYVAFVVGLVVWMVKVFWWDGRESSARLKRTKELASVITNPDATEADKIEAGIEMYELPPDLAERLRNQ